MENKITTRQTLEKLQQNLQDKDFRKEFGKLIVNYFNANNPDTTAFYYKILKLLQNAGFNKEEAESFFKDLRVKNKDIMVKLAKIQRQINDLQGEYKKNRIKILINPLSVATLVALYFNLYQEIEQNLKKLKEEMFLKLKTNLYLDKKVKEIEEILSKNIKELQRMQQDQQDNKATKLNNVFKDTQELQEKLQDLQENLVLQELDNTISGRKEIHQDQYKQQTQDQQQPDQQNNQQPSSPNKVQQKDKDTLEELRDFVNKQQNSTQEELEDCLKAVLNTNAAITDKKTLAFYTISEFLHRGNKEDKELFKHFNGILDKREFDNIVNINKMLLDGVLEYNKVKEELQQGFNKLMELGENVSIKQQKDKREKEKEKEIGIGQPSKINFNMPSVS